MQVILVRHAETSSNLVRALDTAYPGADLTDLGVEQVDALVERLAGEPIEGVWSSDRLRARRTADGLAAAHGLETTTDPRLAEIGAGTYEMSTAELDLLGYRDVVTGWMLTDRSARMPGGETGEEVIARMDAAIADIEATGVEHAVVVSHGAVIRFWCAVRVPEIGLDLSRLALANTGFARLSGSGPDWSCTEWDFERLTTAETETGA